MQLTDKLLHPLSFSAVKSAKGELKIGEQYYKVTAHENSSFKSEIKPIISAMWCVGMDLLHRGSSLPYQIDIKYHPQGSVVIAYDNEPSSRLELQHV